MKLTKRQSRNSLVKLAREYAKISDQVTALTMARKELAEEIKNTVAALPPHAMELLGKQELVTVSGWQIGRQRCERKPTVNEGTLQRLLPPKLLDFIFPQQRVFDAAHFQHAVVNRMVTKSVLSRCLTPGAVTYSVVVKQTTTEE